MNVTEETQGAEAPTSTEVVTPSGIIVEYTWAPKRGYRVMVDNNVRGAMQPLRDLDEGHSEWMDVPSVTTVLGVLDKPSLPWWGMSQGVNGVLELFKRGVIHQAYNGYQIVDAADGEVATEDIVRFLTENRLTVNHVRDRAGDRGTSVHQAFEDWADNGTIPHPEIYPAEEQGYIAGLRRFLLDWTDGCSEIESEVMVGSIEHGYAGRFDLRCLFNGGPVVTRTYPKKPNKVEEIPAGDFLIDLKSSKAVYPTHAAQLIAYETASVECGYKPTDYRAVVHVTEYGQYELVFCHAIPDDFLSILSTYQVLDRGKKEWLSK